jgi:hypothetical protein
LTRILPLLLLVCSMSLAPATQAAGSAGSTLAPGMLQTAQPAASPPISFTRFGSAASFVAGQLSGAELDGDALTLEAGQTSGTWTSAHVEPGFAFTRIVPSWNAETPGGSHLRIELQTVTDRGATSDWYVLGVWASADHTLQRTTVRGQNDALGRVETDTLVARERPFVSYALRVTLARASSEDHSPRVRMVGAQVSDMEFDPSAPTSAPLAFEGVELAVPPYSQETHANHFPQWGGGGEVWCSPTSTQMVVEYWGRTPTAEQLAWVGGGHTDAGVDFAARSTYDAAYRGTGNWPFNTAYAAGFGLDAFVTQLRSLAEAELFIRGGIPLVASIASRPRELTGFLFDGGTNGHLVVIVGFDAAGNPIVNDPAAWSNATVRRVYDRAQFERVWLRGSAGTVYVIRPPEIPLPPPPADATPNW